MSYTNAVFREIVEHNLRRGKGKPERYHVTSSITPRYDALRVLEGNVYIAVRSTLPEKDGLLTTFLDGLTGVQRVELTERGRDLARRKFPEYFPDTVIMGATA